MTLSGEALNSYDRKAYSELQQHVPTLSPSVYPLNPSFIKPYLIWNKDPDD